MVGNEGLEPPTSCM